MANYITLDEIISIDNLLGPSVTAADVDRAKLEAENFALRTQGVKAADLITPIHPYFTDYLAFWTLARVARRGLGNNPRAYASSPDGSPYPEKVKSYKKDYWEAQQLLTKEVLTGEEESKEDFANPTIPIFYK